MLSKIILLLLLTLLTHTVTSYIHFITCNNYCDNNKYDVECWKADSHEVEAWNLTLVKRCPDNCKIALNKNNVRTCVTERYGTPCGPIGEY